MRKDKSEHWYDTKLVDFLLVLFPPLGYYALFKSHKIQKSVKIILGCLLLTMIIVLVIVFNI